MAHFSKLNENNIVTEVIVVNNDLLDPNNEEASGIAFLNELYGESTKWKQTSFNSNFRKNFGAKNSYYDKEWNAFIPPQPYSSWKLDYSNFSWVAPLDKPEDIEGYAWRWSEVNKEWIQVAIPLN